MSAKSIFLVILGWLFILSVGGLAITAILNPELVSGAGMWMVDIAADTVWGWLVLIGGAALIGLAVILPFIGGSKTTREKPIEFTSEVGSMIIEASALEDCLRRTALDDDDVCDATVNIKVPEIGQDQPIICSVRIGIRERPNIPGKGGEIAKKIRDRFLEILPMDTLPIVNLDKLSIQRPKPLVTRTFTTPGVTRTEMPADDLPEIEPELQEKVPEPEKPKSNMSFTGQVQYPVEEEDNKDEDEEDDDSSDS